MLEVKNLVFHPLDNGVEKSIIERSEERRVGKECRL